MRRFLRFGFSCVAMCAILGIAAASAQAGTIIKLSLGDDDMPDIEFDGDYLFTVDDGGAGAGDQQTNVEFVGFLSGETNITDGSASFTLAGLEEDGAAATFMDKLVIQNFTGGTLELYNGSNTLLLSGTLANSSLAGPIGPPAAGALFTTSFGTVTGGTLASEILPGTLTLSLSFTSISDGVGFTVSGGGTILNPFVTDATSLIAADPIPEPASSMLIVLGLALAGAARLRRRS